MAAMFHTSFCMQWIAESSDSSSIDDSAGRDESISMGKPSKVARSVLPWYRLDLDVMLLLLRLVLLLLLLIAPLPSCCSEVCDGFCWNE
jgi:hypothetical protein